MKRSLILAAAISLPLLGLATSAQATGGTGGGGTHGHDPYKVTATYKYKPNSEDSHYLLCPVNETLVDVNGVNHGWRVSGPGQVQYTYVYLGLGPIREDPADGTSDVLGGILIGAYNYHSDEYPADPIGLKGGKIRAWIYCQHD